MQTPQGREFLRRYRHAFERFLGAGDPLTEEEALFCANELGREMLAAGYAKEHLLQMHARVQRLAVARLDGVDGAGERAMYRRLALGDARTIVTELLTAFDFREGAAQALRWRAENLKHQSVLDALEAQVVLIDAAGRITAFNRAWRQFALDNGNPSMRGCNIGDDYLAAYRCAPELAGQLRAVIAGQGNFETRYECSGPEGKRWFILRASGLPIREGGALVMHLDVTRQTLIDARMRAAEKLEAITTQAAGVAHDFNNLLGAILGLTDVSVPLAAPDSRLAGNLLKIQKAAGKASTLVKGMLDFTGEKPDNLTRIMVSAFIGRCGPLLSSVLPESVRLRIECDVDVCVDIDVERFEQVLLNLVSNAAYAMRGAPDGRLAIRVERRAPPPGLIVGAPAGEAGYVCLSVSDNGSGIPAEVIGSIFDPFFTTKPIGEGTGLGLAAAQGIVRTHGGAMDVESSIGNGTTFHIYLPVAVDAAAPTDAATLAA